MFEALLIKLIPFVTQHAPSALGWVIGGAVKAAVGAKTKSLLTDRAQIKAYAAAVRRAFVQFAKEFPNVSSSFFDEHFLRETIAGELSLFLTRDESPDAMRIANAYGAQFGEPANTNAAVIQAAQRFVVLVEEQCKKEKELSDLLNRRQTDENNRILRKLDPDLQPESQRFKSDSPLRASNDATIDQAHVIRAFKTASQELLVWPQTLDGGQWLDRPELQQLVDRIDAEEFSTSLLLGVPGSGKSALLARLADETAKRGWEVLAVKADQLPEELASLQGLQTYYELRAPLLDCMRALAKNGKFVLLIDQLDALSDLVDLKTNRLTLLLRLLNQAKEIPNVHIVASCRMFERTYDQRLNTLDAEEVELALPSWEAIEPLLQARGLAAGGWPESFRGMLRVPQHLNLFLRHFSGTGEAQVFETYQAMLESLWSCLFAAPEHSEAGALVYDIATEMAEREVLTVPTARFDQRRKEVDYAVASGILQYDPTRRRMTFTHQTIFDFAHARAFIAQERSLSQYVLRRQTGLFVRPKLWSALNYLRGADSETYIRELEVIWNSANLRSHIKTLLIDFVGQQEQPLDFEIRLLRPTFSDAFFGANAFASVVGRKAWFDTIASDVLPDAMRGSPEITWSTIRVLEGAWAFAKPRVLELISTLWLQEPGKHTHAWYALRGLQQWDHDAVAIAVKIIDRGVVANTAVQDLASVVSVSAPKLAPELIGAHLRRQVREAMSSRKAKSRNRESTVDDQSLAETMSAWIADPLREIIEAPNDWYEVSGIADAAPIAYLQHVWPPIKETIEAIAGEKSPRTTKYDSDYLVATMLEVDEGDRSSVEHPLVDSLVYAVRACVKQDPMGYRAFVEANRSSTAMTVHRLIAIGLCELALQDPQFALGYLLGDERRLSLENFHESERETKMLIRALIPHLSSHEHKRIEDTILKANAYDDPESEKDPKERLKLRKWNRLFRLRLLLQFPAANLTPLTQELVESELHIFPDFRDGRREMTSSISRSPLSAEKMMQSKDATIAKFLEAFPDETEWGDSFKGYGGSIEASRAFAAFAKRDPKRALGIVQTLNHATQQRPAAYAIRELSEEELPDEALFDLVVKLDVKGFNGAEFRESVAHALRARVKHATGLPDSIVELLERWLDEYKVEVKAEGEEPQDREERTGSLLWGHGGLHILPGGSYPLLNAYIFGLIARGPIPCNRLLATLGKFSLRGEQVEVWEALAPDALRRLQACKAHAAEMFVDKLFGIYPDLLERHSCIFLVAHMLAWSSPDLTKTWIERIFASAWSRAHQAYGELLVLRAVLLKDDQWSRKEIDRLLGTRNCDAPANTQVLCGLVHAASNLWSDATDHALLGRILCAGMDSEDRDVAVAAIDWFRVDEEVRLADDTRPVLEAFAGGKAIQAAGTRTYALDRLSDFVDEAPDLLYTISRRLIDNYKADVGNFATVASLESETLLSIALTLQRQEEPHRTQGLELFELLLHYNAYKARDVLMDIDRRPGVSTPVSQARRRRRVTRPQRRLRT